MYNNNYNYYPQQNLHQQQAYARVQLPMVLKGRPVTSIDEARAASIDFDGSVFYFPDVANKCIYTKQINADGTASLNRYELKEMPIETPMVISTDQFITREEFEQVLKQLKTTLMSQPFAEAPQTHTQELRSF